MTDERLLILASCILIAPHISKQFAQIGCCIMLIVAAAIGFGGKP
jgi:hypothetical protein